MSGVLSNLVFVLRLSKIKNLEGNVVRPYLALLSLMLFATQVLSQVGKPSEKFDFSAVTFKPLCSEDGCTPKQKKPQFQPKDICMVAICLPVAEGQVRALIPDGIEHWRIYPNNTMQLFAGDTPLLAQPVPASAPRIDATKEQVKKSPVLIQADQSGKPMKYWVRVK
jgi:hypothetical protein